MKKENPIILAASLMAGEGVVNGFTEALRRTFTGGYYSLNPGHADFNGELLRMTLNLKPDVVFIQVQAPTILWPHIAKEISQYSFVMQYSGDIRHVTEAFYLEYGRNMQLTTFSNQRDVDYCLKNGVNADFLQIGYDPDIFRPLGIPKNEKDSIVALFNNYAGQFELSNWREEIVMNLLNRYPGKFSVYGNGWNNRESGNFNHSQHEENVKLNHAKIVLNVSHFNADRYTSDRMFRSLGSGSMVLSHRYPNMSLDFQENIHLACFDTMEELYAKIDYYLENEEARQKIAVAGNQLAKQRFTFDCMAENIKNLYFKHEK